MDLATINGGRLPLLTDADLQLGYEQHRLGARNGDNAVIFRRRPVATHSRYAGAEYLAIHGLNQMVGSSDLLMQPELTATVQRSGKKTWRPCRSTIPIDRPPVANHDSYQVDEGGVLVVEKTGAWQSERSHPPGRCGDGATWGRCRLTTLSAGIGSIATTTTRSGGKERPSSVTAIRTWRPW
jgi:hypothetical protein